MNDEPMAHTAEVIDRRPPATVGEPSEGSPSLHAFAPVRRKAGVWQRFRRHRIALIGLIILIAIAVAAIGAPWIATHDPYSVNILAYRQGPQDGYPLGTDSSGRDVLSRLLHAGRVSLSVGLVGVAIYTMIGVVLGALAGYFGGWVDSALMRAADIVLSFPTLIVIITIVSILGPSLYNVMLVIGLLGWPPIARIVRSLFL
jgi:peptide/nickel transport system permease protein